MKMLEGDYASSMVFNGEEQQQLTDDQLCVLEENRWELVQLAISRGVLPVDQAEKLMYEFHTRVHHLGNTSLQAS